MDPTHLSDQISVLFDTEIKVYEGTPTKLRIRILYIQNYYGAFHRITKSASLLKIIEAKPAITDYLLTYKYKLLTFGDRIPRYVRIDSEDRPCLLRNDAAPLLPYFLFVYRENPTEKKT